MDYLFLATNWKGSQLPRLVARTLKDSEENFEKLIMQELLESNYTGWSLNWREDGQGTEVFVDYKKRQVIFEDEIYSYGEFIARY